MNKRMHSSGRIVFLLDVDNTLLTTLAYKLTCARAK